MEEKGVRGRRRMKREDKEICGLFEMRVLEILAISRVFSYFH